MGVAYTDDDYERIVHPNKVDIHSLEDENTVWLLVKETNHYTDTVEYVIYKAKIKNKRSEFKNLSPGLPGLYDLALRYSCDVEFYDEKEMCYRTYHFDKEDLKNQHPYENRLFTSLEEAEKCRIEAETLYIKGVIHDCYEAMQLAKQADQKIKSLLSKKAILSDELIEGCKSYFDTNPYNANSILNSLGKNIEKELKNVSKQNNHKNS